MHDFQEKVVFKKQILKNVFHTKKSHFGSFYPIKSAIFAFYVQF